MVPVARRNLFADKGRFAISVVGVAFAVLLILVVLALYRGFSRTGETFELLPGQLWLAQQGTTDPFHSLSMLRATDLEAAGNVKGVAIAAPVLIRQMAFEVHGHNAAARFMALDVPADQLVASQTMGRYLPPSGTVIIDAILAAKEDLHEGETVVVNGVSLTVGQVQARSGEAFQPFAFVSYGDARRIFGVADVVNFVMVVAMPGQDLGALRTSLSQALPGATVMTSREFATAIRKEIDDTFLPIIGIILGIGFTVGGAVVGLTLYTATIERAREYGVMKAVGASGAFLYRIVLSQSAMLTCAGFVMGLGGALLVAKLAQDAVPDFATQFRAWDIAAVLVATVAMATASSVLPVRRISNIDPAMVFRA